MCRNENQVKSQRPSFSQIESTQHYFAPSTTVASVWVSSTRVDLYNTSSTSGEFTQISPDDDGVELNVLGCRVVLGTNCDQCVNMVQCCFTSTETIRLIRTATSTFTQLLNSELSPALWRLLQAALLTGSELQVFSSDRFCQAEKIRQEAAKQRIIHQLSSLVAPDEGLINSSWHRVLPHRNHAVPG